MNLNKQQTAGTRLRSWCERHEPHIFLIISSLFLAIIVRGSFNNAARAQDYEIHLKSVQQALESPLNWLLLPYDRTNPPIYHLMAAGILRIWGEDSWLFPLGLFNGLLGYAALWLIFRIARLSIRDVYYRFSLYLFVSFLPIFVITSTAFASDCATTLPTLLFVLFLAEIAIARRDFLSGVLAVTLTLGLIVSIKYIGIPLIVVAFFAFLGYARLKITSIRHAIIGGVLVMLFPIALSMHWLTQTPEDLTGHFSQEMGGHLQRGRMNLRSIVFFRGGDARLLIAPLYADLAKVESRQGLFQANYFSYPGLVVYGSCSDILNLYQPIREKNHVQTRDRDHISRLFSRISVRFGFVSFVLGAAVLLFGGMFSLLNFLRTPAAPQFISLVCLFSGAGYFGFIIAILPFATMSYAYGYWHPRLIVAGIVCLAISLFSHLDRLPSRWRSRLALPILLFCGLQAVIFSIPLSGL